MGEAVARHYDQKYAAEASESVPEPIVRVAQPRDRFEAALGAMLDRFESGHLVEIGAGSGRLAQSLLAEGLPCDRYTATDLSSQRLATMRERLQDRRFDIRSLDLDAPPEDLVGSADAVMLVALIEHVFDPLRALITVRKMLRPNGFALIDTPNIAKFTRRLKLLFGRFPATASLDEGLVTYAGNPVDLYDEGHLHYFTFRSLEKLLVDRCGFARVERIPYPTPPYIGSVPIAYKLARRWPELFSEVCVVAYADDAAVLKVE